MFTLFRLLIFFLVLLAVGQEARADQIVDLTYPFDENTIYWPTAKGFQLEKVFWGTTEKGYYYSSNKFCTPEHGGTHIDAPIHFAKGRWTVDQIPVEHLVGEAVVIDLSATVLENADYLISKDDLLNWEAKHRPIKEGDIVLLNTGWSRFWGNKKKYLGTAKFADVPNLHFPGISKEAAEYLVSKRVKGVGLDTPSLDTGQTQDYWAHRVLLGANIYGIENVANLDQLPATGAMLTVAPMKIVEGTGAPTRILALIK